MKNEIKIQILEPLLTEISHKNFDKLTSVLVSHHCTHQIGFFEHKAVLMIPRQKLQITLLEYWPFLGVPTSFPKIVEIILYINQHVPVLLSPLFRLHIQFLEELKNLNTKCRNVTLT